MKTAAIVNLISFLIDVLLVYHGWAHLSENTKLFCFFCMGVNAGVAAFALSAIQERQTE